jgi:N-acetylneuraminic acid mutarotase
MTAMPTERDELAIAVVNGKIYAIGGINGVALGTNEEYDPVSDTWTTKASMPTPRTGLIVAVVNNKIYAIGGSNSSAVPLATNEVYDPVSDTWTTGLTPMPTARCNFAGGVVNGKIYAIGGVAGSGGSISPVATNEEYDPTLNSWTTKTPMPEAMFYFAIAVVNNMIYAIGGSPDASTYASTNISYNPGTNQWLYKIPMPTARSGLAIAVVNSKIYAIGGRNSGRFGINWLATNEEYDPTLNRWTSMPSMPVGRENFAIGVVNNTTIYAIGGYERTHGYLATNTAYKP